MNWQADEQNLMKRITCCICQIQMLAAQWLQLQHNNFFLIFMINVMPAHTNNNYCHNQLQHYVDNDNLLFTFLTSHHLFLIIHNTFLIFYFKLLVFLNFARKSRKSCRFSSHFLPLLLSRIFISLNSPNFHLKREEKKEEIVKIIIDWKLSLARWENLWLTFSELKCLTG